MPSQWAKALASFGYMSERATRVCFAFRGKESVVLLCGGDKSSQKRDIARARALAAGLED
jgi:putative addiction module killer protein